MGISLTASKPTQRPLDLYPQWEPCIQVIFRCLKGQLLKTKWLYAVFFVNPIQFNNPEDLNNYPRTIDDDIKKLEEIECDILFYPEVEEIYPEKVF